METRKLQIVPMNLGDRGEKHCLSIAKKEFHIAELAGVRSDELELAKEIAKRFNLYPRLIAFIQHIGKLTDSDETIDFIVNNYDEVMDDEDGNPIEDDIPFLNNNDIF